MTRFLIFVEQEPVRAPVLDADDARRVGGRRVVRQRNRPQRARVQEGKNAMDPV